MARRSRGDTKWVTANGVHLWILAAELKYKDSATFWWPLYKASRSAAHVGLAWPIYLEEFEFVGLLYRSRVVPTSIYRHVDSGGDLYLEYDGGALRLQPFKDYPQKGRFYPCDIGHAVLEAGLPKVTSRSFTAKTGPIGLRGGKRKNPRDRELGQQLSTPCLFNHPTPPPKPAVPVPWVYDGPPFSVERPVKTPPYPFAPEIWANHRHTANVPEGFVSGRYPRWPTGTGQHRRPNPNCDEFGRCADHLCHRCYEDPNPELSPELRQAMARIEDQFRARRAEERDAEAKEGRRVAEFLARNPPRQPPPPEPPPPHHLPWPLGGDDTDPPSAN